MTRNRLVRMLAVVLVAAVVLRPTMGAQERPNIIFIMADDLGNADLGYRGSAILTPNIDALAEGGVRLEAFYGMPVCTPSRASLMTGRYAMRYGLQTLVIFPSHTYGLPVEERTLPEAMRDSGYATYMVGKWHLGHADERFWPQNRGFDHFYGNVVGEVDYFTRERGGVIDWQRNGTFLREEGYYTTLIGDEAVRLIEAHDASRPFFMYFASLAPHAPYQAPREYMDRYSSIEDGPARAYAAMITCLDDQVGRIVEALESRGIRENTLIVFASDNGGATSALFATGARSPEEREESGGIELGQEPPASNGAFRGGKGSLYEGGVRVPAIFNWPGVLSARTVEAPMHMVDVMPTLLTLAGGRGSTDHPFDGVDCWALILSGEAAPEREVLINVEPIRGAIRVGRWKSVVWAALPGRTELFDLDADPGETTDLAERHPEIVRDLRERLLRLAHEMAPAEWIMAQPQFLGAQGETVFGPHFDIGDGGLPHERPALPRP